MRRFGRELLRRRVPGIVALYAGGVLAILGAIDDLSEGLGWPQEVFHTALLLLSAGILNAAIAGWYHGARNDQRWSRNEAILHGCALALTAFFGFLLLGGERPPAPEVNSALIEIAALSTATGEESELGSRISAELQKRIPGSGTTGETGAGWTVGGSVRRSGSELRIGLYLTQMPEDIQVWADRVLLPADSVAVLFRTIVPAMADSIIETINRERDGE